MKKPPKIHTATEVARLIRDRFPILPPLQLSDELYIGLSNLGAVELIADFDEWCIQNGISIWKRIANDCDDMARNFETFSQITLCRTPFPSGTELAAPAVWMVRYATPEGSSPFHVINLTLIDGVPTLIEPRGWNSKRVYTPPKRRIIQSLSPAREQTLQFRGWQKVQVLPSHQLNN